MLTNDWTDCRFFDWVGGAYCEVCGKAPEDHDGIKWIDRDGAGTPFEDFSVIYVDWEDYGPGKRLNIPLFTLYFGQPKRGSIVLTMPKVWEGDYS